MDPATQHLIEALHREPGLCALVLTGGGSGAAAALLHVPGGSRTLLEVQIPYDDCALADYLGYRPEQYCSLATSRALAQRAFEHAGWLAPGKKVLGLGATASLVTDRPKKGPHRLHVSVHGDVATTSYSLQLRKDARTREQEEAVVDTVVLNALAAAFTLAERIEPALFPEEKVEVDVQPSGERLAAFFRESLPTVQVEIDGRLSNTPPRGEVLLSGAFNPVHAGHWGLAAAVSRKLGRAVAFELSVANVEKPPLTIEETRKRLVPFLWKAPIWITRAATFVEKAAIFPEAVFVVGADTAARIVAPRFYRNSEPAMYQALDFLRQSGCQFLVAGRADGAGCLITLEKLAIPEAYRDLFMAIPESEFQLDISSTEIRAQEFHS